MVALAMATATPRGLVVLVDTTTIPARQHAAVAKTVRAEVDASADWSWRDPPPISMDELLLAGGCARPDVNCLLKMGELLKVDALASVTMTSGRSREIRTVLVQFHPQRRVQKGASRFRNARSMPQAVSRALRSVLGPVRANQPAAGSLVVSTTPPGATVALDDRPAGYTPLTLNEVPVGRHKVGVSMDGHLPAERQVTVSKNKSLDVALVLEPQPKPEVASVAPEDAAMPPEGDTHQVTAQADPEARHEADASAAAASASGPAPLPVVGWSLAASGGAGGLLGVLVGLLGFSLTGFASSLWLAASVAGIQRAISLGRYTYYPSYIGGALLGVTGLVVLGLSALVLGGGIALALMG